ncbi:hypothetical protein [Thalassoglobus sp.]|uniref:hypothetical protein n=1 Tax=Thalassoglobus sp. TaxID=2795869 RepID=UPI003AA91ECD
MTIRYQCPECDSVLKIKDELAGTDGKCPKCKSKFVVPDPPQAEESPKEKSPPKAAAPAQKKAKPAGKKTAKSDDDDFDAAAFLMEDGPGPKASAGLTEKPAAPAGPATDKQGRRLISGGGGARAKASSHSPAAVAADAEINASANARDLLSKTAGDSRVKASSMPMEEKQPRFDFAGMRKELIRYLPHLAGGIAGIFLLYWLSSSMMSQSLKLPPLSNVSGKVTVNGEPLSGVQVTFSPIEDKKSGDSGPDRIRSASGRTNDNGEFTLYYIDGVKGAPRGKGRLSVTVHSAQDLMRLPKNWARTGTKQVEVKEVNREGDFDINIAADEPAADDKKPKKN